MSHKPHLGKIGEEVTIPSPIGSLDYDSDQILYQMAGGQVLVSNAPESIYDDGARRADGTCITGQINSTLYRDEVEGSFRFWAFHHNKSSQKLKFWIHICNITDHTVSLFKTMDGYGDGSATSAACTATTRFMNAVPERQLLAVIPPRDSFYFAYTGRGIEPLCSVVYVAEFRVVSLLSGEVAKVLVSHVVTRSEVEDPTPYAIAGRIARTNATATTSDDYRGILQHWGRKGEIRITLTEDCPVQCVKLAGIGYAGEQENLLSRWDVLGNPRERGEVRFIIPGKLNKLRQAYWYTEYTIDIHIANNTRQSIVQTLYGSIGVNPGFVHYQLNHGKTQSYHYNLKTAVRISADRDFRLRTMVMPSSWLPLGLFFLTGDGV
ncbi:hypothetical protein PV433_31810 [Paenibacillus sp. GYB004]|uniref:hypothetical protein n=1 Tax=Paenibacillus sp. GYB004 TaxID=2994393 RepID=UPI002F9696B1